MIFVLSAVPLHAQVEWQNRYVTLANNDQRNPSTAIPADPNYTIIVWEDRRDDPNNEITDIYAQRVDNANGLAQWQPLDGVLVCSASNNQTNPRAAYDSLGGVIIVWEDYRADANNQISDIYAQRILVSTGQVDPAWPVDGIPICEYDGHQERPRIVGTIDGAFIAWTDWRNSPASPLNRDIYLQYILTTGFTPNAAWTANGMNVATQPDPDQINQELALDYLQMDIGGGVYRNGVVVVFQDNRMSSASLSTSIWTVWAENIHPDATRGFTDVRVASSDEEQTNPRIVVTGKSLWHAYTDAIICWQDQRNDLGQPTDDIYGQRLDNAGNPQWGTGYSICAAAGMQQSPVMTLYEREVPPSLWEPYVAIAWEDQRTGYDIYAALIDVSNQQAISPLGGEAICTVSNANTQPSIDNVVYQPGVGLASIAWKHSLPTGETNIHYQSIEIPSWTLQKGSDGVPATEAKGNQNLLQVSGRVMVFEDKRRQGSDPLDRRNDFNIYCETPGPCVGTSYAPVTEGLAWRDMFIQWTVGGAGAHKRAITDRFFNTYIVWDETRNGCQSVFIQKLDKDGVPRWQNNGIQVSGPGITAKNPDVAEAFNGAVVVWQQFDGSTGLWRIFYSGVNNSQIVTAPQRFSNNRPGTYDHVEPVIVNSTCVAGGRPGFQIGYLENPAAGAGGRNFREFGFVDAATLGAGIPTSPDDANPPLSAIFTHSNLMIASDYTSECYLLTHGLDAFGNGLINVTYTSDNGLFPPNYSYPKQTDYAGYAGFGGYDMCVDALVPVPGSPHHAMVVASVQFLPGTSYQLRLDRFDPSAAPFNPVSTLNPVQPLAFPNGDIQPAIEPDSVVLAGTFGGCLLAWNHYALVQTNIPRMVQTQRVGWLGATPAQIPPAPLTISAATLPNDTWPDIARDRNDPGKTSTTAYIAWEDGREGSHCSPARSLDIYAQYVDYNLIAPGPLWLFGEEMVSPGPGSYFQSRPLVLPSGNAVTVSWYDTRTGDPCVMQTRMHDLSGIVWNKSVAEEKEDGGVAESQRPELFANYPNPVSMSGTRGTNISLFNPLDGNVVVRVSNSLGRTVETVHDGFLAAGMHSFRFEAFNRSLPSGVYFYSFSAHGTTIVKPMIVIR